MVILWEYDRSTEGRGQLLEKVPGYESFLATSTWKHLFPDAHAVRIFFVVPSRQRLATLADSFRKTSIAGHVRIAVAGETEPLRILTSPIWFTPSGDARPLLSSPLS